MAPNNKPQANKGANKRKFEKKNDTKEPANKVRKENSAPSAAAVQAPKRVEKKALVTKPKKLKRAVTAPDSEEEKENKEDVDSSDMEDKVDSKKQADSDSEAEESTDDEDDKEERAEEDTNKIESDAMEVDGAEKDAAAVDDKSASKPSSKEAHEAQKVLKVERKLNKPHAKLIADCKVVWEKLRSTKLSHEEQHKHVDSLMTLMKGLTAELSLKHDTSRIIQNCLKFGSPEHRDQIAMELKGHYLELSKASYGRFVINKILKYCKPYRTIITGEFRGKVKKAIRHVFASTVLEEIFSIYANAGQRSALVQEFYGPEFSLFKSGYDNMTLGQILTKDPSKRVSIMKNLQETLTQIMDKSTVNHSIVHHAIREYLDNADEKQIQDMVAQLKELAVEILHTQDGAQVVMKCLLHATAKDRKIIVRSFKPFVSKIAKEEYGHLVLFRLFDVVDDTALVEKNIICELIKDAEALLSDKVGRRVIAYLLVGRNKQYLYPGTMKMMEEHDKIRSVTSKKDANKRAQELRIAIAQPLIDFVTPKIESMIRVPYPAQIIGELFHQPDGDKSRLVEAILPLISSKSEEDHVLEHITANRLIKAIVLYKDEATGDRIFARNVFSAIPKEDLVRRAMSWGSFIVYALLETETDGVGKEVADVLKPSLDELKRSISGGGDKKINFGTKLIVEKLEA